MRALKAVLVMAGALKMSSPDVAEDLVLIQAMRDANIPKLTSEVCRGGLRHRFSAALFLCHRFHVVLLAGHHPL